MFSPYGLDVIESCLTCHLRTQRFFCDLEPASLHAFENIKAVATHPRVLYCSSKAKPHVASSSYAGDR